LIADFTARGIPGDNAVGSHLISMQAADTLLAAFILPARFKGLINLLNKPPTLKDIRQICIKETKKV